MRKTLKKIMSLEGMREVLSILGLIVMVINAFMSVLIGNRTYFVFSAMVLVILGPRLFKNI